MNEFTREIINPQISTAQTEWFPAQIEPRIFLLEGKKITLGELSAEMYVRSCARKRVIQQEAKYVR